MLVEEVMSTEFLTSTPTTKISKALNLLQKHRLRHITIVNEKNQVVGIVSDRDVRDASPSILDDELKSSLLDNELQSIMSTPVITVHPLDFIEEIAHIFFEEEFAALPVVSNGKLIGIITEKDMLYTLIQLTGTNVPSSRVEIKVANEPGILPNITAILGDRNINITSLLIYPYKDDPEFKTIVIRFQAMNPQPIIKELLEKNYELLWPNHQMEPPL